MMTQKKKTFQENKNKIKKNEIYYIILVRLEMAWNVLFILLDYTLLKINEVDIFVSIEQTYSSQSNIKAYRI